MPEKNCRSKGLAFAGLWGVPAVGSCRRLLGSIIFRPPQPHETVIPIHILQIREQRHRDYNSWAQDPTSRKWQESGKHASNSPLFCTDSRPRAEQAEFGLQDVLFGPSKASLKFVNFYRNPGEGKLENLAIECSCSPWQE